MGDWRFFVGFDHVETRVRIAAGGRWRAKAGSREVM
jgi:hypothetical protein